MTKSVGIAPVWTGHLTADIPLNSETLSEDVKSLLRPYAGQCLNLVWRRLPITVRNALNQWWENV